MPHGRLALERARQEAEAPGWACMCACDCGKRHWNIEPPLCHEFIDQVRQNSPVHGEEDA